jgi:predicted site-specific integrase-resolvase
MGCILALIGLTEAAKLTGKDKATIHRALKSGKLSCTLSDSGERQIDPAELGRVFPIRSQDEVARTGDSGKRNYTQSTGKVAEIKAQLEAERMKIAHLQERLADRDNVIDDLRSRLDLEGEERRKLTAILTDQRERAIITPPPLAAVAQPAAPGTAPAKKSWWRFGGHG